jgi:hypothetical protein
MGDYRITIEAMGGHGCQREKGDGEFVVGCERHNCPDCMARELVRRLKRASENVKTARIEHWPADLGYDPAGSVTDDLLSGRRTGAFPERERYLAQASPSA